MAENYNYEHEKEKINQIFSFCKSVHAIKSSIYRNSWRKRGWDTVKCNYFRKMDALETLFLKKSFEELSDSEKSALFDNLMDMLIYSGLFLLFVSGNLSGEQKEKVIRNIANGLNVDSNDNIFNEL